MADERGDAEGGIDKVSEHDPEIIQIIVFLLMFVGVAAFMTIPLWTGRRTVKSVCDLCGRVEWCRRWTGGKAAADNVCAECRKMEEGLLR
jgi:hypothetical protein